ncbi:hypothetical protein E2C01_092407 [Portunus trituberculatus]|uniref:Uncharacterized protein n=1 Tax=Portunus trituberculatus TaxID=210409 RepID=A0A5B7JXP9_PORTR|nr:hypothetical protein [Portunus trituberculatus]
MKTKEFGFGRKKKKKKGKKNQQRSGLACEVMNRTALCGVMVNRNTVKLHSLIPLSLLPSLPNLSVPPAAPTPWPGLAWLGLAWLANYTAAT